MAESELAAERAEVAAPPPRGSGSVLRRPVWAPIALVAALAALALGAWSLQLRGEVADLAAYREGVVAVLEAAARPGAELAFLDSPEAPSAAGPTGLAAVGADGSVAIVIRALAPTSGAQVYEAWLIPTEGAPIPIGQFTVDGSRTASFVTAYPPLGSRVTVALTLEPGPGATTPTLPFIALGAVQQDER